MESTSASAATNSLLTDLPRLLAVTVGLPVAVFVIDQWAIQASKTFYPLGSLLPILFVVQVGVLSASAGRFVENVLLRCVVFAWSIVLVDAVAATTMFFGRGTESQCMVFALFSGQIGLLTIWGMMSRISWPVRIPIFLAAISLIVIGLMRSSGTASWRNEVELWAIILAMQSGVAVGLCAILRFRGYRLMRSQALDDDSAAANAEQFQFSIKHVIFWTTAVCPILVLAKGVDFFLLESQELFRVAVLAIAMAVVSWVAMLSALGASSRLIRLLTLSIIPPAIGGLLAVVTSFWTMNWNTSTSAWLFIELREFGIGWVQWSVLAAWFLFALLLVFRASGYRVLRKRRTAGV